MRLPHSRRLIIVLTPSGTRRFARALALACVLAPALPRAEATAPGILIRLDERQQRAAGIDVTRVQAEAGTTQTVLPGTVSVPPQQLRIVAAPAAGLLEAVLVAPNEPVREDQPIARLRSTELLEAQRLFLQAEA